MTLRPSAGVQPMRRAPAPDWPGDRERILVLGQVEDDRSVVLGCGTIRTNAALLADRLLGLRAADAFSKAEPAPERSPSFFGAVHIDESGRRWQELKLQSLSQTAKFLSIRA